MGTWNASLYGNDEASDVRAFYKECIIQYQMSKEEAYKKTWEEFKDEFIDEDDEAVFWYALADTQWDMGRLIEEVKDKALALIDKKGALSLWEENPKGREKWEKTITKIKDKLATPQPPEKRFTVPKRFVTNPWDVGDLYAFELKGEMAERHGFLGKYMVFHKVADHFEDKFYVRENYYFVDTYLSQVRVIQKIFDTVPTIEMLENLAYMPIYPCNVKEYRNDKDCYEAVMELTREKHYPKDRLTFVGNIPVERPYVYRRWMWTESILDWSDPKREVKEYLSQYLIKIYLEWKDEKLPNKVEINHK